MEIRFRFALRTRHRRGPRDVSSGAVVWLVAVLLVVCVDADTISILIDLLIAVGKITG